MAARYVNSKRSGVAPRPASAVPSAIAQLVGGMRDGGFGQGTQIGSQATSAPGQTTRPIQGGNPAAAKAQKVRAGFNPQQEAAFKQFTGTVARAGGPARDHGFSPQESAAIKYASGLAGVPAGQGGARVQGNQPGWEDMVGWDEQRRNIDMNFQGGMAQNEQAMNALRAQFAPQDYGFNKEWDQAGTGIGYADNRRGMQQSGVNRDHWQEYGQGRDMALRSLLGNRQGQVDQLLGARGDLERRRGSGLAGVSQAEQWRRAQLAQLIGGK